MDKSSDLLNYLDKNNILWMPINLEVKKGKKKLLAYKETGKKPSYTDFSKKE